MVVVWIILIVLAVWLYMIWPAKPSADARAKFAGRSYAHRGLYDNDAGVPENSLAAFEAAMQHGYGCELDVQFTRDKQLIVFHDNDFLRTSGVATAVWDMDYDEMRALPLFGTDQYTPLFAEVLDVVAGRGPLIVEIKAEGRDQAWYDELCAATMALLRDYDGDYCVESFHPMVVRWFRFHAPDAVRGQLVNGRRSSPNLPFLLAFSIEQLWSNMLTRPHFIAYNERDRNRALRIVQRLGAMTVMWTVKTPERHAELAKVEDAIIFERYMPAAVYVVARRNALR